MLWQLVGGWMGGQEGVEWVGERMIWGPCRGEPATSPSNLQPRQTALDPSSFRLPAPHPPLHSPWSAGSWGSAWPLTPTDYNLAQPFLLLHSPSCVPATRPSSAGSCASAMACTFPVGLRAGCIEMALCWAPACLSPAGGRLAVPLVDDPRHCCACCLQVTALSIRGHTINTTEKRSGGTLSTRCMGGGGGGAACFASGRTGQLVAVVALERPWLLCPRQTSACCANLPGAPLPCRSSMPKSTTPSARGRASCTCTGEAAWGRGMLCCEPVLQPSRLQAAAEAAGAQYSPQTYPPKPPDFY